MLIFDNRKVGSRLLLIRKANGLTQAEVAEIAGLSDRTYADIERGIVNMRIQTLLQICEALHITPDELFVDYKDNDIELEELLVLLSNCTAAQKKTATDLLRVYLKSL